MLGLAGDGQVQEEATGGAQRVKVQALMADMGLLRKGSGGEEARTGILAGLGALGGAEKAVMQVSLSFGKSLGQSLGMKNATEITQRLHYGYEATLRAMLVAMSSGTSGLVAAFDTAGGAYLEGIVPRSILVLGGKVMFDVIDSGGPQTEIIGTCLIPGQKYGYGAGKKALSEVFEHAETLARRF